MNAPNMITTMGFIKPIYLNASRDFGKWFAYNWRKLEDYFTALGGDKYNNQEYIAFCQCQFYQQQHSPIDESILNDAREENARYQARQDRDRYSV